MRGQQHGAEKHWKMVEMVIVRELLDDSGTSCLAQSSYMAITWTLWGEKKTAYMFAHDLLCQAFPHRMPCDPIQAGSHNAI